MLVQHYQAAANEYETFVNFNHYYRPDDLCSLLQKPPTVELWCVAHSLFIYFFSLFIPPIQAVALAGDNKRANTSVTGRPVNRYLATPAWRNTGKNMCMYVYKGGGLRCPAFHTFSLVVKPNHESSHLERLETMSTNKLKLLFVDLQPEEAWETWSITLKYLKTEDTLTFLSVW